MPILIESDASYQFTKGEPLGAAALNAIGSPNIHPDLTAITEDDVDAVPASKLRPLHGSKIRSIQPHNLPAAEKGDIIYYDPATAEWGLLNIGDEGDFLTPLGWNSKSTPLPTSTKEVIKFQPQRGIFTLRNDSTDVGELGLVLEKGTYHCYLEGVFGRVTNINSAQINPNDDAVNISVNNAEVPLIGQSSIDGRREYQWLISSGSGLERLFTTPVEWKGFWFVGGFYANEGKNPFKLEIQGLPKIPASGKKTFGTVNALPAFPPGGRALLPSDEIPPLVNVGSIPSLIPKAGVTLTLIRISEN